MLSSKHWEWKTCPHERTATSGRREEYNSLSSVGENARSSLHKRQFCPNGWVAGLWKPEEGKKKKKACSYHKLWCQNIEPLYHNKEDKSIKLRFQNNYVS